MIRKICFWSAALAAFHPIRLFVNPISAVLSGLGSVLGFLGGSDTNSKNLQIARETNQMNWDIANLNNQKAIQLMREQNQWNLEQWNRENQYNRPSMQVRRLLEAGINPAFSNQVGNGNSYVGLQSAPAPSLATPTMQAAVMQNPLANVASDFNSMANAWKAKAEEAKAKNDIKRENRQTAQEIKESESRIEKINADAKAIKDLTPQQIREIEARIENVKSQTKSQKLERRYRKVELTILKAQQNALKQIPEKQLLKTIQEIRHLRTDNDFQIWRNAKIQSEGIDPVGQDAYDALLRKAYLEFIGGKSFKEIFTNIKDIIEGWVTGKRPKDYGLFGLGSFLE